MLSNKVLLATDFSETAEKLINCLDELKGLGIDEVILTHVINVHRSKVVNVDQFKEANQDKLDKIKEKIEAKGFKVTTKVPVGFPASEINKVARNENAALILVASHGKGFIKKVFLGSTTYDLIRKSKRPVLIEKYENIEGEAQVACARKFNKVLLPIDFSDCSRAAIDFIKEMEENNFEEIILLNVIESSRSSENLEKEKTKSEVKLKELAEKIKNNGSVDKVTVKVAEGAASENIIEIAQAEKVGLILMPRTGRGNIKELLLGSTSDRVAKESPVPVLLLSC
ncbi:MAG: universal stress protein [Halarsenatibacteraceae bacterium]